MIKVSVVVPIYNAEKYLKQCLDSIVSQTLKDIEIILIDDGSTDGSAEVCKIYLSDERIKYYYKKNAGAVMARKDGIEFATGEYIGFVDADDWIEENMYQAMYEAAENNNADIVFCNCIQNENDHYFSPEMESGFYDRRRIEDEVLPKSLAYISNKGEKRAIRWSNCLRLYRKELLMGNIRYNQEVRRCEDLVLNYEATLKANSLVYLGEQYLYHNRIVPNSKSRRYTVDAWQSFKNLISHLYEDTEQYGTEKMMEQMHLRAFFSVTDCLENELKFYRQNKKNAMKQIRYIMEDEINEKYCGMIPIQKMNKKYQTYYKLIQQKRPRALIFYEVKRQWTEKIEKRFVNPIIHIISEGKLTKGLYKKIRQYI